MPAKSMFDLSLEGKELEASDLTGTELLVVERFNTEINAQETCVVTLDALGQKISPTRRSVAVALGVVGNNQTVIGSFEIGAGFTLRTIETSASMRVRLYQSAAARDADLSRPQGTDRPQGVALFLEFYSVIGLLDAVLSPVVDGFTTDGELYYSVQNKSLSDQAMTMSFLYLPTEV